MATNSIIKYFVALALTIIIAGFFVTLSPSGVAAEAWVDSGDNASSGSPGCNGGGKDGCPWSSNGYGWYELLIDGGWGAPKGNGRWDGAVSKCRAVGARKIIAFVVFTGEKTWDKAWIMNWDGASDWGSPYTGNITTTIANSRFDELPSDAKVGYTFASNVGVFCYDIAPPPPQWSLNAQSYILRQGASSCTPATKTQASFIDAGSAAQPPSPITAYPGDCLLWRHAIRATNGVVTSDITHALYGSGFRSSVIPIISDPRPYLIERSTTKQPVENDALVTCRAYVTDSGCTTSEYTRYNVTAEDAGKTLCQWVAYTPISPSNGGRAETDKRCATIPYNFTLVPDVSIGSMSVEVGTDQTVTGTVKNNGPTRSTAAVSYRLTRFVYKSGASFSTSSISNTTNDACAAFAGGSTRLSCTAVADASGTVADGYTHDGSGSYPTTFTVDDLEVGTQICFVMSVTPNTHRAGSAWRHSAMKCHVIGKKPKVQVWGGDVLVRQRGTLAGDIATSITSQKDGTPRAPTSSPGLVCPTAYIAPTHEAIPRATADFDLYPRTALCGGSLDKKFVVAGDKFDIVAQVHNAGTTKSPDGSSLGEHVPYTLYAYNVKTTAAATMEPGLTANFTETVPANLQGDIGKVQYAEKDFANTDPGGCEWLASTLGGTSAQCRVTAYNSNNKRIQFDVFTSNKNNLISGHYASGAGTNGRLTLDTTGYVPGDRVCYFLAIRRFDVAHNFMTTARDSTNLTRRVSRPVCVDIISSAPTATVNNYGSWGEYALVSPGEVRNMASGSGFQGGSVSNNICGTGSLSLLTFNNWEATSALCPPGKYATGTTSPAVGLAKYFNDQSYQSLTSNTIDPENVASSPGVYRPAASAGGTITLQAATGTTSTIRVGKWAVLYAPGKVVNINSDIRYQNSSISSARSIPQLVIIANQIRIASTVKNVDAWLVARQDGTRPAIIHTCGNRDDPNATQCNDRLRVNGPVITEQLLLKRTAGGGVAAQAGEPAEVFNARPDAYLWFIETFGGGQRLPTASTTELPPRF